MAYPALSQGNEEAHLPSDPEASRLHLFEDDAEEGGYRIAPVGLFRRVFQGAGALISLGLIGLAVFWGYKQTMRDLHGVPVVRALDGPMRVAPENPGGQIAVHEGLAVNKVQASGSAAPPESKVVLAPEPVALTSEDVSTASLADVPQQSPEVEAADAELVAPAADEPVVASLSLDDPIAMAVAEAMGQVVPAAEPVAETPPVASGPGLPRSPRPLSRPGQVSASNAQPIQLASADATIPAVKTTASAGPLDPDAVPAGTRMVQLGFYDTKDEARAAWDQIAGKFDGLMDEKSQVIIEARAGGRTIWRLRAMGFEDLSDARRFCSALVAERTDCIPVMAR